MTLGIVSSREVVDKQKLQFQLNNLSVTIVSLSAFPRFRTEGLCGWARYCLVIFDDKNQVRLKILFRDFYNVSDCFG